MRACLSAMALCLAAAAVVFSPAPAAAQADRAESALRAGPDRVVHDLGTLLKPAGVREIEAVDAEFRAAGRRLRVVTLPKGTAGLDRMAADLFQKLGYGERDLLILFNGSQTQARTPALRGRQDAFQAAMAGARDGFRRYHAAGLSSFARSLLASMETARPAGAVSGVPRGIYRPETNAVAPSARRTGVAWGVLALGLIAVVLIALVVVRASRNRVEGPTYTERLKSAEAVYQRVTLNLPDPAPAHLQEEWLALDHRLDRCRSKKDRNVAQLLDVTSDLEAFERKVKKSEADLIREG